MALKRQRGDESPKTELKGGILEPFGEEAISELQNDGNPNFTRGAFGDISIALRRKQCDEKCLYEFVAIKTIEQAISSPGGIQSFGTPKQDPKLSRDVFNELCALFHLNPHPNIVPLIASFPSKSSYASSTSLSLAFTYAPTDLFLTLEWRRRTCSPLLGFQAIKAVAHDLFEALAHCHGKGVLHRDVKPGNLLVSPSGTILLCDFGLAKPFLDEHSRPLPTPAPGATGTKGLCTLFYRPPEVLLGGPANHPAIDIYSAGLVLAELISGKPIFEGRNVVGQLSLIFDHLGTPTDTRWQGARLLPDYGKLEFTPKEPKSWSERLPRAMEHKDLPDFLDQLVNLDPSKRMSAAEALHNRFVNSDNIKSLTKPDFRQKLIDELIPASLQIPPLLAPNNSTVMTRLALGVASKRRSFLSRHLASWKGADLCTTTLQDLVDSACA
jgi:serine/threonine protein kinase